MNFQLSNIHWKKTILYSVLVVVATAVTIFLLVFGYALVLGVQAQDAPNVNAVGRFAGQVGSWSSIISAVMTFLFALLLGRRVGNASTERLNLDEQSRNGRLHGLILGLISGTFTLLINLATGDGGVALFVELGVTVSAGFLGGLISHSSKT